MEDLFICYNHSAEFVFRKDLFLRVLGLNPEAFYDVVSIADNHDNTIKLRIGVRNSDELFLEKNPRDF